MIYDDFSRYKMFRRSPELTRAATKKSLPLIRSRDRNGAGIRGEESGRRLIMAGRGEAGASYDGVSWGEAGRSGAGRDNDLIKRGGEGIQLNPRNFPEFEFY